MRNTFELQKRLMPDVLDIMKKRYTILQQVRHSNRIGRRALATSLSMTERVLRAETDFLKSQGLLDIQSNGMEISEAGIKLLDELEPEAKELFGLSEMEEKLRRYFHLKQVWVVAGDSDTSVHTKKELGRAAAQALKKVMESDDVIAVTGGTTLAHVADQLHSHVPLKSIRFVPARGGLGESVDYQANTIVSTMAKRVGAQYRLLHVPDHLGEEAYVSLMQEPGIKELVEVIRSARIVLHGIGDAMVMARRRKVGDEMIAALREEGALAEAFGFYFNKDGNVVHRMQTAGLRIEDIQRAEVVIGVAGGRSKGEAIGAILRFGHEDILVTDEAAAEEIIVRFGL